VLTKYLHFTMGDNRYRARTHHPRRPLTNLENAPMARTLEARIKSHPVYVFIASMLVVIAGTVGVMTWMDHRWGPQPAATVQSTPPSHITLDPQTVLTAATNQVSHMRAFMANGQMVTPRLESMEAFSRSLNQHQLWAAGFIALDNTTLFSLFKERANPELFAQYKTAFFGATEALNAMSMYFKDIADGKRPPTTLTQEQVDREFLDLRNAAQEHIATLTGFLASRSASDFK
jgi:hypothetical protein